jgi:hypothetical protein
VKNYDVQCWSVIFNILAKVNKLCKMIDINLYLLKKY